MSRLVAKNPGLNMDSFQLVQLLNTEIVSATPSQVVLQDANFTVFVLGSGLFVDERTGQVGGTITSIDQISQQAGASFRLDGLNVPLLQVLLWLDQNATETFWSSQLAGADTISGSGNAGGPDLLRGHAGNDIIEGGAGSDSLFGGAGNDTVAAGVVATGGAGNLAGFSTYLRGDDGNDSVIGGESFDDINGNMGADTCMGGGGVDWVVGGKDNDLLYGDVDAPTFRTAGDDIVYGNLGDDTCSGGAGNDLIRGGQDNDVLFGEGGNDWLSGDRGSDTMTGGAGNDTFHSFSGAGVDRVLDFAAGQDRIQLDAGTTYTVRQQGADTIIDMGAGDQVILVGVSAASLPAGSIFIA